MSASVAPPGDGGHARAAGTPRVAALTVTTARDAALRRWVRHYGAQLGRDALLVVDVGTSAGPREDPGCPVVTLPVPDETPTQRMTRTVPNWLAQGLLRTYDAVVYTAPDELLVPDPDRYAGLPGYVAAHPDRPVVAAVGLEVLLPGDPGTASPGVDRRAGAGAPRVRLAPGRCKPALKREPYEWGPGAHAVGCPFEVDPDLLLLHVGTGDGAGPHATPTGSAREPGPGARRRGVAPRLRRALRSLGTRQPSALDTTRLRLPAPGAAPRPGFYKVRPEEFPARTRRAVFVLPDRFRSAVDLAPSFDVLA